MTTTTVTAIRFVISTFDPLGARYRQIERETSSAVMLVDLLMDLPRRQLLQGIHAVPLRAEDVFLLAALHAVPDAQAGWDQSVFILEPATELVAEGRVVARVKRVRKKG